ncbi:hypothetical protein D9M68_707540 [compost metagenome]
MQVTHLDVVVSQVVGEVLGHALGQGSDQHPLLDRHALADLGEQVIHLGRGRAHFHLRIHQASGPHYLLDHPAGVLALVGTGGGRDEDGLRADGLPLVEPQRAVIQRRGQPEAVLHQGFLARAVALEHGADLGNRDVGFVDHQQRIGWQIVVERRRRLARSAPGEIAGVVFDTVAVAEFEDHLQVEAGALLQALGFHQLVGGAQLLQALLQLLLDLVHCLQQHLPRRHIVALGVEGEARQLADDLPGERVEGRQVFNLVVEQLDTDRLEVGFRREYIDDITANAESSAGEIHVVAGVLELRQAAKQGALV